MTVRTTGEDENELTRQIHEFSEDLDSVVRAGGNEGGNIDHDDLFHYKKVTL